MHEIRPKAVAKAKITIKIKMNSRNSKNNCIIIKTIGAL